MSLDPYEILLNLEENCRQFARPLPRQKISGKIWQGIGFISSNVHFVTPLAEIKEILAPPDTTPLPFGASWFRGVANLRGHLLPITDLQGFVLETPHHLSTLSRILVIDFEQTLVGFLVQQVLGVQRFPESLLNSILEDNQISNEVSKEIPKDGSPPQESHLEPKFTPYLQGQFTVNEKTWYVLSLKALSQTTQFYHVMKNVEG